MGQFFTIAAHEPFIPVAAQWLQAQSFERPPWVILPNQRSARALMPMLSGPAMRLPQLLSLAQIPIPLLLQHTAHAPAFQARCLGLGKAIPSWEMVALLTRLMLKNAQLFPTASAVGNYAHAYHLAQEMAEMFDVAARYGSDLTRETLRARNIGGNAAEFLGVIAELLPQITAESGRLSQAAYETQMTSLLAEAMAYLPAEQPVILMGSTGSLPATLQLMHAIRDHPHGAVLLPGYEVTAEPVMLGHPHYFMQQAVGSANVIALSQSAPERLWPQVFGQQAASNIVSGVENTHVLACDHEEEEARTLAVVIRHALESPEKTLMLVTPDIALMRRVALALEAYGIIADSPSLIPLAQTPAGQWLQWLWVVAEQPENRMAVRAFFEHPQVQLGKNAEAWRSFVATFDLEICRGFSPSTWAFQLQQLFPQSDFTQPILAWKAAFPESNRFLTAAECAEWIQRMQALTAPDLNADMLQTIYDRLHAIDGLSQPLQAAQWRAQINDWLQEMLAPAVRATHPNIRMLTPVEARLMHADTMVLAGFHEAAWPSSFQPNAWLNEKQKQLLGLPTHAHTLSLSAHDVWMLAQTGTQLFLSYSKRLADGPATRSRFLERLQVQLAPSAWQAICARGEYWRSLAKARLKQDYAPLAPPSPTPVTTMRPHTWNVSQLDALMRNPYAIYVSGVLQLEALAPYDEAAGAKEFGNLAHKLMEACASGKPIAEWIEHKLTQLGVRPDIRLFWHARLLAIADFAQRYAPTNRHVRHETKIEHSFLIGHEKVQLRGRIDRMEQGEGAWIVADYKSGEIPSNTDIAQGLALQLIAYGWMLHTAEGIWPTEISYWKLPQVHKEGQITSVALTAEAWEEYTGMLRALLEAFYDASTPLLANPRPYGKTNTRFSDVDGISRIGEWG